MYVEILNVIIISQLKLKVINTKISVLRKVDLTASSRNKVFGISTDLL